MDPIKIKGPALAREKGTVVNIPNDLRNTHPAVRQTLAACRNVQTDYRGLIEHDGRPGIQLRVSRKHLRRALLIAQGFINAIEARGYRAVLSNDGDRCVELNVNGAVLGFSISESLRKEPYRKDRAGNDEFRTVPTGHLSLHIFSRPRYLAHGRTHRDGRTFPLESRLALAIPDLEAMAERALVRQEQERERDRVWQAAERRTKRREQASQRQQKLASTLKATVESMTLVDNAFEAAGKLRKRFPGSKWASSVANWVERAARKIASPRIVARLIPVDLWSALGNQVKERRL